MSTYAVVTGFFGGIGLFLLGMHLLTDGLKLAAGRALEDLLEKFTSTPVRGLAAGVLVTSLVQSSTAVTLASIGFVNTGLLSLRNGLWVIFGSNVGSTMNAWLVAALGFGFKIESFALPFVGVGAILIVATKAVRTHALGQALAGFGVLFIGISVLQSTFSEFGANFNFSEIVSPTITGYLILVALGTLLTLLMQASGAVIALVITAAQGGLLSVDQACAIAIGTNIGTTFTAILAAIGATPNAKRLAASHVFFNAVTTLVAMLLLFPLVKLVELVPGWFNQTATPAVSIALFHTTVNVLGALLMVPFVNWLLRYLSSHFSAGNPLAKPRFIDSNALAIPDLAVRSLRQELGHSQRLASEGLLAAVATPTNMSLLASRKAALDALADEIDQFAARLTAMSLPKALSEKLAQCLRVLQYQQTGIDYALHAAQLEDILDKLPGTGLTEAARRFSENAAALAGAVNPDVPDFQLATLDAHQRQVGDDYDHLKGMLLNAGASAQLSIRDMQERLRHISMLRRAIKNLCKSGRYLTAIDAGAAVPEEEHAGEHELADDAV